MNVWMIIVWRQQGLHAHSFGGFTLGLALQELYLGACRLRHLPLSLVRDLVALRRLHLWSNELEMMPSRMFNQPGGGGRNLVELSLWGDCSFMIALVVVYFCGHIMHSSFRWGGSQDLFFPPIERSLRISSSNLQC